MSLSRQGFLILLAVQLCGQSPPSFEVATVRPTAGPIPGVPPIFGQQRATGEVLTLRHTPLAEIIRRSFGLVQQELAGGPAWINEERFDIVAKAETPTAEAELWTMMQPLLMERFKLAYHREPREVAGMELVVAKDGLKMTPSEGGASSISAAGGILSGHNVPLSRLAQLLSSIMRRPVVDATGLSGAYDFMLDPRPYAGPGPLDLPGLFLAALPEEFGLKLDSKKVRIQTLVIDRIERPTEN